MSDSKFIVVIDTENSAFDEMSEMEVSRILKDLAQDIESGRDEVTLRDFNGNKVGHARFVDEG